MEKETADVKGDDKGTLNFASNTGRTPSVSKSTTRRQEPSIGLTAMKTAEKKSPTTYSSDGSGRLTPLPTWWTDYSAPAATAITRSWTPTTPAFPPAASVQAPQQSCATDDTTNASTTRAPDPCSIEKEFKPSHGDGASAEEGAATCALDLDPVAGTSQSTGIYSNSSSSQLNPLSPIEPQKLPLLASDSNYARETDGTPSTTPQASNRTTNANAIDTEAVSATKAQIDDDTTRQKESAASEIPPPPPREDVTAASGGSKRKAYQTAPSVSFADVPDCPSSSSFSVTSPTMTIRAIVDTANVVGGGGASSKLPPRYSTSTVSLPGTTTNSLQFSPSAIQRHSHSVHTSPVTGVSGGGGTVSPAPLVPSLAASAGSSSRLRIYKSSNPKRTKKWVTREIAALDFLLGIPLEAEQSIVHQGWTQLHGKAPTSSPQKKPTPTTTSNRGDDRSEEYKTEEGVEPATGFSSIHRAQSAVSAASASSTTTHRGRWWEKWISNPSSRDFKNQQTEGEELEQPDLISQQGLAPGEENQQLLTQQLTLTDHQPHPTLLHAPGRRLEGDEATLVQIPLNSESMIATRQRSIARQASIREWELRVAHGIGGASNTSTGGQVSKTQHGPSSSSQVGTQPTELERYHQKRREQEEQQQQSHLRRQQYQTPMLDGRMFFSAMSGYPMGVFSLIRYDPKNEEAVRRRKKLEARGGGGTQFFIMPERDWRGISYSALLPSSNDNNDDTERNKRRRRLERQRRRNQKLKNVQSEISAHAVPAISAALTPDPTVFDRFATIRSTATSMTTASTGNNSRGSSDGDNDDYDNNNDDALSIDSISSEEDLDDTYVAGLLDDPDMVQGRHRNVMIGDRVTGCIVASTIQFVKPSILKADLNKKFRDRFDGWEPPKSQHRYIGARVVDGVYTLLEPGGNSLKEDGSLTASGSAGDLTSSAGSKDGEGQDTTIRMPPSLTLSKIRSIKRQALEAAVKAKLELGTVALAFVYFERLCLDCRVDKTNRRLSFAACLLLAIKINESHVGLVMKRAEEPIDNSSISPKDKNRTTLRLQSLIRPTKKSNNMFASVLEFFIQDWSLSLKHLFAAEWGVFAALQFRLHAKPSHVAFHFKRLIKSTGWDPLKYLGSEMYGYWQESLSLEEYELMERTRRREMRQKWKEREKIARLQHELEIAKRRELGASGRSMSLDKTHLETGLESDDNATKPVNKESVAESPTTPPPFASPTRQLRPATLRLGSGINFLRFGAKRAMSSDKLYQAASQQHEKNQSLSVSEHKDNDAEGTSERSSRALVPFSPSMPAIAGSFSFPDDDNYILNVRDDADAPQEKDKSVTQDGNALGESDEDGGIII